MNKIISIQSLKNPAITLQSIGETDLENLRNWKNMNKNSFFHTAEINPQQQLKWYEGYLTRPNDSIFMVLVNNIKIGCMGFRKMESENIIDIYNIILGDENYSKKGYMTIALKMMCNYAYTTLGLEVTVKVLKSNPAADWYKKNNFVDISPEIDYFYLKLNKENFEEYTFESTT